MTEESNIMPESLVAAEVDDNKKEDDEFVDEPDPEKQTSTENNDDDVGLTMRTEKSAAELLEEDIPWRERYLQVIKTYAPLGM